MEENLVNGLIKATHVDGYIGVFRTKQVLLHEFRKSLTLDPDKQPLPSTSSEAKQWTNFPRSFAQP
jgi:hypothetical protein